jgi:hypothetical protein
LSQLKENMHHLRSKERDTAIRQYMSAVNTQTVKDKTIEEEVDTKRKAHKFKVDFKKEAREREENIMKMVRERKAQKVVDELQMSH